MESSGIIINIVSNNNPVFLPYSRITEVVVNSQKELVLVINGKWQPVTAEERAGAFVSPATAEVQIDYKRLLIKLHFVNTDIKELKNHLNAEADDQKYGDTWY